MYNTAQQFQFSDNASHVIVVKANGGSVSVECKAGAAWVVTDTFAVDTATEMFFGSALFRVTPTGGAEFDVL